MLLAVERVVLRSESDTSRLARVLGAVVPFGNSVGLRGELGAGKTTLVRYLIEALGGEHGQVSSPSFTLQNEYKLPKGKRVEHWDLYRVVGDVPEELYEPPASGTLRLVEWPERAPALKQYFSLLLDITTESEGVRVVRFEGAMWPKLKQSVVNEFIDELR